MYNTDIRVYVFCGTCGGVLLPSHFMWMYIWKCIVLMFALY